jgi:hypothetical protein
VPWLEHLHLRHHAVGEQWRGREVRQALERVDDLPRLSELGAALGAGLDVRQERGDAESGLAVQELVDFVW